MRQWLVASGIVEGPEGILLVRNLRRDGSLDWSPPGGVIEVGDGESVEDGLTREVFEETGIIVDEWAGPVWSVEFDSPDNGWAARVEVYRAVTFAGSIAVDDPDGIVVDARFVALDACEAQLLETWLPTREPFVEWLAERWEGDRAYRYRITGARPNFVIDRLP